MIFGTDGVRGRMGDPPLDRDTMEKLSAVLAQWLPSKAKVVIGSDTRNSCSQVKAWILTHLAGITVIDLGIVPTPVVAYETRERAAQLGVMITASHNPAQDNGLKFFDETGLKIRVELARLWSENVLDLGPDNRPGATSAQSEQASLYRDFILRHFSAEDFKGLRMGFDLANGAGSTYVKELVNQLGIDAKFIGDQPDGHNINDRVGALHPSCLEQLLKEHNLDLGFALDGDGDRLMVADPEPLHGDITLYALYQAYLAEGQAIPALVGTIMCGMGLQQRLAEDGVDLIRTPVGDQNVLHEMVVRDLPLGGETSGHLIQADLFPSGDGFLGALRLARALKRNPGLLDAARAAVPCYPTYEKAIRVVRKPPLESLQELTDLICDMTEQLADTGRLIIRYSGTEPKLRIYMEAPDLDPYLKQIAALEDLIDKDLS